jgi:hypothetical protein
MRIRILFFSFSLVFGSPAGAQADIKAMLKQIALIAVHVRELENAIEIAKEGLTTIHDIKNGEFNLQNLFFSSLKSVNPSIARYGKIAEIIAGQVSILTDFQGLVRRLKSGKRISSSELTYVQAVYTQMTDACSETLNNLIAVTTDGDLEMTDDERIKRIDGLYRDMKDRYAFTGQFTATAASLDRQRDQELLETQTLKILE